MKKRNYIYQFLVPNKNGRAFTDKINQLPEFIQCGWKTEGPYTTYVITMSEPIEAEALKLLDALASETP